MTEFKWRHFAGAVILHCVRWYCKYGISYRDLSMKTAYATLKGFEVMRMFRKGQFACWYPGKGVRGEVRLINRQFSIYEA